MWAYSPKQSCSALWYPWLEWLLQLLVMEEGLSSDPTRGSRCDFPVSRPGRTTFVLLLYLGHMGNVTGEVLTC